MKRCFSVLALLFAVSMPVYSGDYVALEEQLPGEGRPYFREVTPAERTEIYYIITTLADKPLASLLLYKANLEAAGARIDHLHPLRILLTIFADERLKVGIHNMRHRGRVWTNFCAGISRTLQEEAERHNLPEAYFEDLVQELEIEYRLIEEMKQRGDWHGFIDALVICVPRKGDHRRYDI